MLEIERTIEERNVKHQDSLPINGAGLSASTDRPMLFNCSSESPSIIEIANEFDGIEADNKISDVYEKYQSTEVRTHVQAHKLILPELSISNTDVRVPQGGEKSDARKSETIDIPSLSGEQHRLPKPYSMRRLNALLTKFVCFNFIKYTLDLGPFARENFWSSKFSKISLELPNLFRLMAHQGLLFSTVIFYHISNKYQDNSISSKFKEY